MPLTFYLDCCVFCQAESADVPTQRYLAGANDSFHSIRTDRLNICNVANDFPRRLKTVFGDN